VPARSNALSELTRFWLEQRHQCLVSEAIPVPVTRALSDIDFLAFKADGSQIELPDGAQIGPRLIVETKDEHDWEPLGREFAKSVIADLEIVGGRRFVPAKAKDIKFTMLRQEHFEVAAQRFGSEDFDRLFVVHALERSARAEFTLRTRAIRVHWMTAPELVCDLETWYRTHSRATSLRNSLVGDLLHLLWGFCGMRSANESKPDSRSP
jgi:hypothetical protein